MMGRYGQVEPPRAVRPPVHTPARPGTADPTEPPATAEQLRDLIRENQRLRAVERGVLSLVEEAERRQMLVPPWSLRRALGGGDDA